MPTGPALAIVVMISMFALPAHGHYGRAEAGPAKLARLLAAHAEAEGRGDAARVHALRAEIDRTAHQKDSDASGLYWHIDLDAAKAAARASGRPILSLRLLGRLDEELSCANSRFFRTALYANAEVSRFLRESFVLHWSSERPAPVITIDFGDGRKVVRTITGNSIHYVLDAEGRPVDALPGLYSPSAFIAGLRAAREVGRAVQALGEPERGAALRRYHRDARERLRTAWARTARAAGLSPLALRLARPTAPGGLVPPSAVRAIPIAVSKAAVERPALRRFMPPDAGASLGAELPWDRIARVYGLASRLDESSKRLIRAKNPRSWIGGAPRPLTETELAQMLVRFERTMAEDTARNELSLHARIHEWLAGRPGMTLAALNTAVYRDLFLTPRQDAWLGLVPPNVFSGIADDGIVAGL